MLYKKRLHHRLWSILISPINLWRANWRILRRWRHIFGKIPYPELHLEDLYLRRLPILLYFANVYELYLGRNHLKRLPKWLKRHDNLMNIYAAKNQFKSIPSVLFELKQLERLHLGSNNIKVLPKELLLLENLQDLSVPDCNLECLPDFISEMNLTSLDINYNIKIDKLPESIGNLKYLSSFYASETSITELPYSILDTGIMRPIGYDMFRESLRPQGIIAPAHYFETKYPTYANLFHQLSLPDAVTKNISHYQSLGNCYKLLYATVPFEEIDKHITIFWNRRFQQFAENKEESRLLIEDIKIDTLNVDWSILTNSSITHLCLDSCIKEHLPKEIGLLTQLRKLEIKYCTGINKLPTSFEQLTNLETFKFDVSSLPFEVDVLFIKDPQKKIRIILEAQEAYFK